MPTLSKLELFRLYIRATGWRHSPAPASLVMRLKKVESHHGVKYTWNIVLVKANTIPLLALELTSFALWNIDCVVTQSFVWQHRYISSLTSSQPAPARLLGVGTGRTWGLPCFVLTSPHLTWQSQLQSSVRGRGERFGEGQYQQKGHNLLFVELILLHRL